MPSNQNTRTVTGLHKITFNMAVLSGGTDNIEPRINMFT